MQKTQKISKKNTQFSQKNQIIAAVFTDFTKISMIRGGICVFLNGNLMLKNLAKNFVPCFPFAVAFAVMNRTG